MAGPFYVDNATGDNGNAGTSEGAGNAWHDVAYAATQVAAGEIVYVKNSADYTETVIHTNTGTELLWIRWVGYASTIDDGGVAVLNPAAAVDCVSAVSKHYIRWDNFKFTNGDAGYDGGTSANYIIFWNCEFSINTKFAAVLGNDAFVFVGCKIHTNSGYALDADRGCAFVNCVLYANGNGVNAESVTMVNTIMYGLSAGDNGLDMSPTSNYLTTVVSNCTFDGEGVGNIAIRTSDKSTRVIINNIFYDWAAAIDDAAASAPPDHWVCANNLINSNTADYSAGITSYNDVTAAPGFTDEDGDDYTLGDGSPAKDAGLQPGGIT